MLLPAPMLMLVLLPVLVLPPVPRRQASPATAPPHHQGPLMMAARMVPALPLAALLLARVSALSVLLPMAAPLRALQALQALRTLQALQAPQALQALQVLQALQALRAPQALRTPQALRAPHALQALRALGQKALLVLAPAVVLRTLYVPLLPVAMMQAPRMWLPLWLSWVLLPPWDA